eukprot:UN20125
MFTKLHNFKILTLVNLVRKLQTIQISISMTLCRAIHAFEIMNSNFNVVFGRIFLQNSEKLSFECKVLHVIYP